MSQNSLMAWTIVIPLLAATGAFTFPRVARRLGLATMFLLVVLAGLLAITLPASGIGLQPVGGWEAPLGIRLRADGLAVLLLLAVAGVGFLVSLHAHDYFGPAPADKDGERESFFWPLWLLLAGALNALFLSADIFNLYVTLELTGLAAVALVALTGGHTAMTAALRYLFVSLAGSLLYLMGVALLYGGYATMDLSLLATRVTAEPAAGLAFALMSVGLLMKSALFPMHFWLPTAHAGAPAPVSALLSALVVKGGFYILLRLWFEVFDNLQTPPAAQGIGILGAAAIFWGSFHALTQNRLKLLVAYSTVAQLGYLFLVFPLATDPASSETARLGGMVYLGSHAAAKAAMFLAAGNILRTVGHDRIRELAGIQQIVPVSMFALGLAGLSLVGLPPTTGFVGKWLLLGAGFEQGQWWWIAVILAGSFLSAGYMIRLVMLAFTRTPQPKVTGTVSRKMEWSAFALAVLSFGMGFVATVPARLLEVSAWTGGAL